MHGDARGFAAALATERYVVQLGDLTDHGPESAAVLRLMLERLAEGRATFLLGNHDFKLFRALAGRAVTRDRGLEQTLSALDPPLRAKTLAAISRAPAWLRAGNCFFVHAAFHPGMLAGPPPPPPLRGGVPVLLARALFGQTTGRTDAGGYPERKLSWLDRIPPGLTVFCGHDRRSRDGRPLERHNAAGGAVVFLDTGAGKGGHLSWLDL